MKFKIFLRQEEKLKKLLLLEHEIYKSIPKTKCSFIQDHGNVNIETLKHSHVYAARQGKGNQLYSVNIDGTGHDGSSGIKIPKSHADFFRSKEYRISQNNILEYLDIDNILDSKHNLFILID